MSDEKQNILILSADLAAASDIGRMVRRLRMRNLAATDVPGALLLAARYEPRVVVLHGDLFNGGSLKFLAALRAGAHTALTPVVAIAAAGGPDAKQLRAAGVGQVLEEPYHENELGLAVMAELSSKPNPELLKVPHELLGNPQRMSALIRTGWLDSPPEDELDALTLLASQRMGAPVALISLVDKNRQFFKSETGLADPLAARRETPLTHSFCQWVVTGNDDLVVDDAREHKVLGTNQAVRDMGVVAYAGVPIRIGGQCIGSFCAIDTKPKAWTPEDIATLRALADVVDGYAAVAGGRRTDSLAEEGRREKLAPFLAVAGKGIASAASLIRYDGTPLTESHNRTLTRAIAHFGDHIRRFMSGDGGAAA